MNEFWFLVSPLLVIAIAFIALPVVFYRPSKVAVDERVRLNVGVYRQRLKELENDLQEDLLEQEQYKQLCTECQRSLLVDTEREQSQSKAMVGDSAKKIQVVVLAIIVPLMSWLVYAELGSVKDLLVSNVIKEYSAASRAGEDLEAKERKLVEVLEDRLLDKPDNAQYISYLASTYMNSKQYERAVIMFAKLIELYPSDAEVSRSYAQALYYARDRKVDSQVRKAFDQVLALNPNSVTILSLLGMDAFEQQNYREAIEHWQRALNAANRGSDNTRMLERGIASARQKMVEAGQTPPDVPKPGPSISVSVSLAEGLSADPEQILFIFARSGSGSPMPLAIHRLKVKDLPVTVTLDDSTAMMPDFSISKYPEVVVVARISKSGGVAAQSGDLEGKSAVLNAKQIDSLKLVIDKIIP